MNGGLPRDIRVEMWVGFLLRRRVFHAGREGYPHNDPLFLPKIHVHNFFSDFSP